MSVINSISPMMGASGASSSGFVIEGSGLFDGSSGYLSRTFTSEANHSGSFLIKHSELGTAQDILGTTIGFNASDQLVISGLTSTAVFRDPSAWMHLFWNNVGAYINGTLVTGTGTYATVALVNPKIGGSTNFFGSYMALAAFGDNQSWTLGQAGETTDDGFWSILTHSFVSAGTDTFLIKGGTDMAAGTDSSGNSNNFTKTGTITATNDSPTNDADNDYGNYATLDPNNADSLWTFSEGNKRVAISSSTSGDNTRSTINMSSGKWYWEILVTDSGGSGDVEVGICLPNTVRSVADGNQGLGSSLAATGRSYHSEVGSTYFNGTGASYGDAYTDGDVIGVALDLDNGNLFFSKNDTWQNSATSGEIEAGTGTNAAYTGLTDTYHAAVACSAAGARSCDMTMRFDHTDVTGTVPSGFSSLSTANLPTPAVTTPTTSPSFIGNANADGPFLNLGAAPDVSGTSTINGNTITWGTHARAAAAGVKIITASTSYNSTGTNTISIDLLTETEGGPLTDGGVNQGRAK